MRDRRTRLALALAAVGLVAVGAMFAAGGSSNQSTAKVAVRTSDGDLTPAMAKHLAKLQPDDPGQGRRARRGERGRAWQLDRQPGGVRPDGVSEQGHPAIEPQGRAQCVPNCQGADSGGRSGEESAGVGTGRSGHGSVPVHAVPHGALVRANGVRDGRADDRSRNRSELRLASGLDGRSRSRSVPDVDHARRRRSAGAPRTRSLRTRSGGTWAGASGSTRPGRSRSTRTIRARTRSGSARARATRAAAAASRASGSTRRPTAATTGRARTAPRRSTPAVSARSGSSRATRTRSTRAPRLPSAVTRPSCCYGAVSQSTGH